MQKTLLVRYSQIGDVLIAIPILYSLANQYPDDEFTVLTNPKFSGLFRQMPQNVNLLPMIYRKKKVPLRGLVYLFDRYLLLMKIFFSKKYDNVALLQRGTFEDQLQKLLSWRKSRVAKIDLTEFLSKDKLKHDKFILTPSISELYAHTLSLLGYHNLKNDFDCSYYKDEQIQNRLFEKKGIDPSLKRIGIAPFSRLKAKVYPLEKIEEIIRHFHLNKEVQVLIFGGGDDERMKAEEWKARYPSILPVVGNLTFDEEITIIASCKVMLSMDSANLHLASLVKTPVVSVWGPSHPRLGYYPANQSPEDAVQMDLYCRPCSFWGENPCTNEKLYACMDIPAEIIIRKIENYID